MTTNDPAGTVQRMFAGFRAGDIDAVLETANADPHWTYIGDSRKRTSSVRRVSDGSSKRW